MARTREFEPAKALEQALHVFWQKGYEDTSFEDIVDATNVSRYGLYGAFGNKRDLFRKALRHYAEMFAQTLQADLRRPDAALPEIRGYFDTLLKLGSAEMAGRGCMVCNTAVEVAPHDPEIAADVRELFGDMIDVFRHALANAQRKGEIRPDASIDDWAVCMAALTQSAAVMARVSMDMKIVKQNIDAVMSGVEREH